MSRPGSLHERYVPTPCSKAYSAAEQHSARADDLSVVGAAPHFEFCSLRMMLFLVTTFVLVFSICALYDNVRSNAIMGDMRFRIE